MVKRSGVSKTVMIVILLILAAAKAGVVIILAMGRVTEVVLEEEVRIMEEVVVTEAECLKV